jgi:pimeloyl-ACP methyl ester carboxylesterase
MAARGLRRTAMPFAQLPSSPHAEGVEPVSIYYRETGNVQKAAPIVVFLHGGWGYRLYPIDPQITAFGDRIRLIAPDRSRYGRSQRVTGKLPTDFHQRAAEETLLLLGELGIEKPVLWGHSDGAVISAMIGLMAPERVAKLVLEAFHFYRVKPRSRGFFERFTARPEDLGEETKRLLFEDHGPDAGRVVERNCRAWIDIDRESTRPDQDLYRGRLGDLRVPTLFVHGACDPRTEPDELERVQKAVPQAEFCLVERGQHSPHSEEICSGEVNRALERFGIGRG